MQIIKDFNVIWTYFLTYFNYFKHNSATLSITIIKVFYNFWLKYNMYSKWGTETSIRSFA